MLATRLSDCNTLVDIETPARAFTPNVLHADRHTEPGKRNLVGWQLRFANSPSVFLQLRHQDGRCSPGFLLQQWCRCSKALPHCVVFTFQIGEPFDDLRCTETPDVKGEVVRPRLLDESLGLVLVVYGSEWGVAFASEDDGVLSYADDTAKLGDQ